MYLKDFERKELLEKGRLVQVRGVLFGSDFIRIAGNKFFPQKYLFS